MNFWHAIFHVMYKYWGLIIIICNFSCFCWSCKNSNVLRTSFSKVQTSKQWDVNRSTESEFGFCHYLFKNAYKCTCCGKQLWRKWLFLHKMIGSQNWHFELASVHPPPFVSHCICNRKNQEKILLLWTSSFPNWGHYAEWVVCILVSLLLWLSSSRELLAFIILYGTNDWGMHSDAEPHLEFFFKK